MLNLYDTAMNPGAAVVKLLTGQRPLGNETHSRSCRTQSHLLHLVEPVDGPALYAGDEARTDSDINFA